MSEEKIEGHTSEPWKPGNNRKPFYSGETTIIGRNEDGDQFIIAQCNHNYPDIAMANARRIVACVNACAGMDDPESWIKACEQRRDEAQHERDKATEKADEAQHWLDRASRERDEARALLTEALEFIPTPGGATFRSWCVRRDLTTLRRNIEAVLKS